MASDSALMPLGIVSITTDPPLGVSGFRQSLHLTNATAEVSTSVGSVSAYIDAESNRAVLSVRSADPSVLFKSINVTVLSIRPRHRFEYAARCAAPTAAPDSWSQPAGPNSLGLSHRNEDADAVGNFGPNQTASKAYFNSTLHQQGLDELAPALQPSDRWRHRTFGLVVSASGLVAASRDQANGRDTHAVYRRAHLHSIGSRSQTEVTITTLAEQSPSQEVWEGHVAARHAAHVRKSARGDSRRGHDAHWQSFWERSHIWVTPSRSTAKASPSSPPSSPPSLAEALSNVTRRYAQTRYMQAIQAGTWVPIKFNGGLFMAQLPPETNHSGPTYRGWGAANCKRHRTSNPNSSPPHTSERPA